jgi:hypothetical protein
MSKNDRANEALIEKEFVNQLQDSEKIFNQAEKREQYEYVLNNLQNQVKKTYNYILDKYRPKIMDLIRITNLNLNFIRRYEKLRQRFLEGEDEPVYDDLILLNKEALDAIPRQLNPQIITQIQSFLGRIADLIYREKVYSMQNNLSAVNTVIQVPGQNLEMESLFPSDSNTIKPPWQKKKPNDDSENTFIPQQ